MNLPATDTPAMTLSGLTVRRGTACPVGDVSLTLVRGELVGLIGPNGAGKTTLMRAALGLVPGEGHASLASMPTRLRARAAAWLPQDRRIVWPVSVESVVALGRIPHLPAGRRLDPRDHDAVEAALSRMGLLEMRHRPATELSGGEQARVLIARTLAQQAPLILADEPIAGLDPAAQISTMRVFSEVAAEGCAVMVSLHDLGLAARHCHRLVLIDAGRIVADAPPAEVLTESNLAQVFGVSGHFAQTPAGPVFQALEVVS